MLHAPDEQVDVGGHAMPQPPQLLLSLAMSTQAPLQLRWFGGQFVTHVPAAHTCPPTQALPQRPQFVGSLNVSTQRSPQRLCPIGHGARRHAPISQVVPGPHTTPHAPQLPGSLRMSRQTPEQRS